MDLIFKNMVQPQFTIGRAIDKFFGWKGSPNGNDYLVPASEIDKNPPCRNALNIGYEVDLSDVKKASLDILAQIRTSYDDNATIKRPHSIPVFGDLGVITKLGAASSLFSVEKFANLSNRLEKDIIPLMVEKFSAEKATAISVNASLVQQIVSFCRVAILVDRFPDKAAIELNKGGFMRDIMGDPTSVVYYPSIFSFLGTWGITLPIERPGVVLHFYSHSPLYIERDLNLSAVDNFLSANSPLTDLPDMHVARSLGAMKNNSDYWNYLRFLTMAVNSLMSFLSDPREFAAPSGEVNFVRQAQALSSVNLLFSDLQALLGTVNHHARVVFANSALDKLANLRGQLASGSTADRESTLARNMGSFEQMRWILRTIKSDPIANDRVKDSLCRAATEVALIQNELRSYGNREKDRLEAIRNFRDTIHGAFLHKEKYESLFLGRDGRVPRHFCTLPWILCLGFMLAPKEFINFRPEGRT